MLTSQPEPDTNGQLPWWSAGLGTGNIRHVTATRRRAVTHADLTIARLHRRACQNWKGQGRFQPPAVIASCYAGHRASRKRDVSECGLTREATIVSLTMPQLQNPAERRRAGVSVGAAAGCNERTASVLRHQTVEYRYRSRYCGRYQIVPDTVGIGRVTINARYL